MISLDHVNYFSKETIKKLLQQYSYEIIAFKSSVEIKLFIMYTLYGWLKRKQTTKSKSDLPTITASDRQAFFNKITRQPKWMLRLFIFFHNALYKTLSSLNIGEEIVVVARRK